MNGSDAQIKNAYEVEGLAPSQIAEDLGFEEVAVKAKLAQLSAQYRKDCKMEPAEEDDLNFSKEQLKTINAVIYECATCAELPDGTPDFRTRSANARYIRDDCKGRLEPVKAIANGNTFNILTFNESLQTARQLAEKAKQRMIRGPASVTVDV